MRIIFILIGFFFLHSCSKHKTVLICGDHICVNKSEAQDYFEKNMSLEVKIYDNKNESKIDLVELNLKDNEPTKRKIQILKKDKTNKKVRSLSNDEIAKIKNNLKNKKKKKTIKRIEEKTSINQENKNKGIGKMNNKASAEVVDVCSIIKKCDIDHITNYLIKQGRKKNFPDITIRE